jgi:hypothetical protein
MADIQAIIDDLKNIHEGDAWHGLALKEILSGVTAAQAAACCAQHLGIGVARCGVGGCFPVLAGGRAAE